LRLLLDTQALIWFLEDDRRLAPNALAAVVDESNDVLVSVVSLWEIAIKTRIGKLPDALPGLVLELSRQRFTILGFDVGHLNEFLALPRPTAHRDPFDQLLLAQAAAESAIFVTADRALAAYGTELMDAGA